MDIASALPLALELSDCVDLGLEANILESPSSVLHAPPAKPKLCPVMLCDSPSPMIPLSLPLVSSNDAYFSDPSPLGLGPAHHIPSSPFSSMNLASPKNWSPHVDIEQATEDGHAVLTSQNPFTFGTGLGLSFPSGSLPGEQESASPVLEPSMRATFSGLLGHLITPKAVDARSPLALDLSAISTLSAEPAIRKPLTESILPFARPPTRRSCPQQEAGISHRKPGGPRGQRRQLGLGHPSSSSRSAENRPSARTKAEANTRQPLRRIVPGRSASLSYRQLKPARFSKRILFTILESPPVPAFTVSCPNYHSNSQKIVKVSGWLPEKTFQNTDITS